MSVINRSAVIIRPLPPYLAWAKQDDTTNIAERVFEDLRTVPHVYLLPEYEDAESEREVLEDFWPELFAAMLNCWLTDEQQWPKNRTHQMFSGSTSRCVRWSRICIWMKRWSNSTRAGHAAIPDSRRPDIRIGRVQEKAVQDADRAQQAAEERAAEARKDAEDARAQLSRIEGQNREIMEIVRVRYPDATDEEALELIADEFRRLEGRATEFDDELDGLRKYGGVAELDPNGTRGLAGPGSGLRENSPLISAMEEIWEERDGQL